MLNWYDFNTLFILFIYYYNSSLLAYYTMSVGKQLLTFGRHYTPLKPK